MNLDPTIRYYALHKPVGVVTTMRDPQGRPDMRRCLPHDGPRVFPVGRLDRDSEGLLLLTNDGDLANRIMHPRHGVEKEYLAEVDGTPTAKHLARLRRGVELDDGPAQAVSAKIVATSGARGAIQPGHGRGPQARGAPAARRGRPSRHPARPAPGRAGPPRPARRRERSAS